MNLGTGP